MSLAEEELAARLAGEEGSAGLRALGREAEEGILAGARIEAASMSVAEGRAALKAADLDKMAANIKALNGKIDDIVGDLNKSRDLIKTQVSTAEAEAKTGANAATAAAEKTAVAADGTGLNLAKSKFGLPSTTTLMGVALVSYCIYALATFMGTNGATLKIKNMTKVTSTTIDITYSLESRASGVPVSDPFCLRPGDSITISGCAPGCTVPSVNGIALVVTKIQSSTNCTVETPTAMTSVGLGSSSCDFGTGKVTSTYSTQFAGSLADTSGVILNTAGTIVKQVISTSADVANAAIDAGGDVAHNAFCKAAPFLCKSSTLWIGGIICLLCFMAIMAFFLLK